jgi:hypothetical protein
MMELYSAIRNNNMWLEGKWMQLEDIILSEVRQAQKDKGHMFSSYVEDKSKGKHIHKNKHDHVQTHM